MQTKNPILKVLYETRKVGREYRKMYKGFISDFVFFSIFLIFKSAMWYFKTRKNTINQSFHFHFFVVCFFSFCPFTSPLFYSLLFLLPLFFLAFSLREKKVSWVPRHSREEGMGELGLGICQETEGQKEGWRVSDVPVLGALYFSFLIIFPTMQLHNNWFLSRWRTWRLREETTLTKHSRVTSGPSLSPCPQVVL